MASLGRLRCSLIAFLFFCLYSDKVSGFSGAFYADNGREQSILYRPLARKDRQEMQEEILHLLGLEHRPRPRHHDTESSAPKYLLDLYRTLENIENTTERGTGHTNSNRAISDSDIIVSFINRIHHKSPHLRHEKDRRFWFDVSEVPPEEEIVGAELRLFRNVTHTYDNLGPVYTLSLYTISEGYTPDANLLELVDELIVSKHDNGWLVLNVTNSVMNWIAFPHKNHGLYLKIKTPGTSRNIDPHELGIIGSSGPEEQQPFMVAYFKTPTHVHIRRPRAAKKRQHDSYLDKEVWNPFSSPSDRYPSRRSCERWTLYVSFRDLGWQDWIIAPDGYGAFYCHGECSFPLNAHMNATNHAIVQTLVHLMDPSVVPKPCCAPTQLSAITVLYFDDSSNVILKKYKNMVVKSCGCH